MHSIKMEFLDYSHVEISSEFISHVLYGEEGFSDKGGHLSGMRKENKTEFPANWSPENVVVALHSVLRKPHLVRFLPPRIILQKEIDNVLIEIVLRQTQSGLVPHSAFPLYGEGVIQNILGRQHQLSQPKFTEGK